MGKPYRLLLVSLTRPGDPKDIVCSNQMIAYGLWTEFGQLPHVTRAWQGSDEPLADGEWDFVLIHAYLGRPIYDELPTIRQRTRHKIMVILEIHHDSPLIDHSFLFLPSNRPNTEHVPFPVIRSLLAESMAGIERAAGSILLDHVWLPDEGTQRGWSPRLYEWLQPLSDSRVIAQMQRRGYESAEHFPPWVRPIPEASYPHYLKTTAPYEHFILTHPGSYEHGVIDMAARGIRVLVPVMQGKPFCPASIVKGLGLSTFSTRVELLALLERPATGEVQPDPYTDMAGIVAKIDAYCQEAML